jgi:hypothetical protein
LDYHKYLIWTLILTTGISVLPDWTYQFWLWIVPITLSLTTNIWNWNRAHGGCGWAAEDAYSSFTEQIHAMGMQWIVSKVHVDLRKHNLDLPQCWRMIIHIFFVYQSWMYISIYWINDFVFWRFISQFIIIHIKTNIILKGLLQSMQYKYNCYLMQHTT